MVFEGVDPPQPPLKSVDPPQSPLKGVDPPQPPLIRGENEVLVKSLEMIAAGESRAAIYEYWQANLEGLKDENLLMILEQYAQAKLSSLTGRSAYRFADNLDDFNRYIKKFPLGSIALNKELAIKSCELALTVFTFQDYPENWANTQICLGNAYSDRIRGERADNLETAIACYREALKVRTFEAFPENWALTQMNLGNAYSDRIRGERADNLETAIACYQEALKVFTFEAFPYEWATTQNNLGIAYSNRIRGERADNLENAIACYQEALKVRTFDAFPQQWATTQINLGIAYSDRIRGERTDNLETAIACYQEALKIYTFTAFPQGWADTQICLGNAYSDRIKEERADNLETAIACYQEALKVYTFDAFPEDWARTQYNLALTYADSENQRQNWQPMVLCYQNALAGYLRAGHWPKAAQIGLILGKIAGDQGEWYKGLDYLETSLTIYREYQDWQSRADTIYQIAHIHHLIGNEEKATTHYRDALRLYQFLNNQRGMAFCQASLGRLLLQKGLVEKARQHLETATQIFQALENPLEVAKLAEVLHCIQKIQEKQVA